MIADIPNEVTISSTTIYRGKLLHFKKATVRLQSGRICTREIVEHPGAVTLIPIMGDKVVLIRQFRLPATKAIYELPAGTISEGEGSEACAEREIVEETGYKAGKLKKIFQCYLAPGYSTELMHFYVATDLELDSQHFDEDEVIRVYPTPLEDALVMVKKNEIMDAKTAVGLLFYDKFERHLS